MGDYTEHLISMAGGDGDDAVMVKELSDEPDWLRISRLYEDLRAATGQLHADIQCYNKTLNELDGLGTSVANGRDRISLLRKRISLLDPKS